MRRILVITAMTLSLSACGSNELAVEPPAESAAPPAATTTATPERELSATDVAEAVKAAVPEIEKVLTITEDNDPNDKIGRPGGYVDGAVMFDSRTEAVDEEPGVDQGAFLEVWPDTEAAKERSEFIQSTLKDADGLLGSEYHYQHEGSLLRVSGDIKPSKAKAYEAAFNSATSG